MARRLSRRSARPGAGHRTVAPSPIEPVTRDAANDTLLAYTATGGAAPWSWFAWIAGLAVVGRWLAGHVRLPRRAAPPGRPPNVLAARQSGPADRIDRRPRRGRRRPPGW